MRPIATFLPMLILTAAGHSQSLGWRNDTPTGPYPMPRWGHALTYDAARQRVVLFGGSDSQSRFGDTWEWDGTAWSRRTPAGGSPPARSSHALVYDAARKRVVLFGGIGRGRLQDTWEWDGTTWSNRTPTSGNPPARSAHALAYDAASKRVVLFGGDDGSNFFGDTWEWDGRTWSNRTPVSGNPPTRSGHGLAYDAARQRVVLFGGASRAVPNMQDTWEWNGTKWLNRTPAAGNPPARSGHALAYDGVRRRLVLFGGSVWKPSQRQDLRDTWEWDGTKWSNRTLPSGNPPASANAEAAYDAARQRVVLFGLQGQQDTWLWNGTAWTDRTPKNLPPPRSEPVLTYDAARQRIVMVGGFQQDTWEWNGTDWSNRTPASGKPPKRYGHALAYDRARERVVLFGGNTSGPADTWEWDGTKWSDRTPKSGNPRNREGHALAYDTSRQRVVLFGGDYCQPTCPYQDTWEWDGTSWSNRTPKSGNPPPRSGHGLAYDPLRKRLVLFGGSVLFPVYQDTWEWDGTSWSNRTPKSGNPPVGDPDVFVYDAARQRVVMVIRGRLWEWDGVRWTQNSLTTKHSGRGAYDEARQRLVTFGAHPRDQETWTLGPVGFDVYGAGCGNPVATLSPRSDPKIGGSIVLRTWNLAATARFGVLALGATRRNVDLTGAGMPSCRLLQSLEVLWGFAVGNGTGSFTLPIPNQQVFAGIKLPFQSIVRDPGANAAGLLTSNGGEVEIVR